MSVILRNIGITLRYLLVVVLFTLGVAGVAQMARDTQGSYVESAR
jgi:hypothetical protein